MGLTMAEKRAVTKEMAQRYRNASKKTRGQMLDELCALAGWSRDHARRALREAGAQRVSRPRALATRAPTYGSDVVEPLRKIWGRSTDPAASVLRRLWQRSCR